MLYHVSEFIVFVLFLPVLMHIVLPLGMLAGWSVWKGLKNVIGVQGSVTEKAILGAR